MEKKYAVGIDIGGGSTTIGIVDRTGSIVSINNNQGDRIETQAGKYVNLNDFAGKICEVIKKLAGNEKVEGGIDAIAGIGIGAPSGNHNLRIEWGIFGIDQMIKAKMQIPVFLDNDANVATVGEWRYGDAKNKNNFIMITLGTGLGSGIVSEGKLIRGQHKMSGEFGHIVIRRSEGRKCGCGRYGCTEAYASAKGMARTAIEFLQVCKNENSNLKRLYDERKNKGIGNLKKENEIYKEELLISSKDVYEAAIEGDKVALQVFEYTGKILGEALADFAALLDPEVIYLFGGLAYAEEYILDPVRKHMNAYLINALKGKIAVKISSLNANASAAILGASALVWE